MIRVQAALARALVALAAPLAVQEVPPVEAGGTQLATGFKIGEVSSERALLWARRTQAVVGDGAAAAPGELQAAWWPLDRAGELRFSAWVAVELAGDAATARLRDCTGTACTPCRCSASSTARCRATSSRTITTS